MIIAESVQSEQFRQRQAAQSIGRPAEEGPAAHPSCGKHGLIERSVHGISTA